jgi:site-specific recombinase XerD
MQKVVAIMRSFLRFLTASGEVSAGLDQSLESPRHHRGERLVRALRWQDVASLLNAIDRSTVKGCRDYAMLLLIATYGLRRGESPASTLGMCGGEPVSPKPRENPLASIIMNGF